MEIVHEGPQGPVAPTTFWAYAAWIILYGESNLWPDSWPMPQLGLVMTFSSGSLPERMEIIT